MCIHQRFIPDDPPPEPMRDALVDDVLAFAAAWVGVSLRGMTDVRETRALVQRETERLRCIAQMMEDGI